MDNRTMMVRANSWAHARRHFANAMKIAKTADKTESFAAIALKKISAIYAEEDKISDVPSGKRIKVLLKVSLKKRKYEKSLRQS